MKKTYQQPESILMIVGHKESFLASSPNPTRRIDFIPENTYGKELPGIVGETSAEIDAYCGRGQGKNGSGNRTNSGLWDDEED